MPNGYAVCPTCGCPQPAYAQGLQTWAGPAWGGPAYPAPGMQGPMMHAQAWGGQWAGPAWGYGGYGPAWGPSYAPAYYGGLPTDSEIEEMIYDAIDADPLIPFDASIDVSVEAGTVYLRGDVSSKRIKHAAGDDAWWIPGVVDVHNEIKVAARRRRPEREPAKQAA